MTDIFHVLPQGTEGAHSITEPCACNPDMTAKGDHWIARHNDVEEA